MTGFYLGTHRPGWLTKTDVPLFVSRSTLSKCGRMPRAQGRWALDSGGFTELDRFHRWTIDEPTYVAFVRRCVDEVGNLDWAAPMDWVCEPTIVAGTGLSVAEHQERTVENILRLRALDPELPFIPVLQGFTADDYHRCVDLYASADVDLTAEPIVGLGTVCRRQNTAEAREVVRTLVARGIRLHGLGVKVAGLEAYADALASADSMSWSYRARMAARDGAPSCDPVRRKTCANCLHYALEWRERAVLPMIGRTLWNETPCAA